MAYALAVCERTKPNLMIMDIRMPGNNAITACREIVRRWPDIQVIMLTSFANDEPIADAIRAGAVGYDLKQVGTQELMRALEAVRQGVARLDPGARVGSSRC